jgi:hypothetical protein
MTSVLSNLKTFTWSGNAGNWEIVKITIHAFDEDEARKSALTSLREIEKSMSLPEEKVNENQFFNVVGLKYFHDKITVSTSYETPENMSLEDFIKTKPSVAPFKMCHFSYRWLD